MVKKIMIAALGTTSILVILTITGALRRHTQETLSRLMVPKGAELDRQ